MRVLSAGLALSIAASAVACGGKSEEERVRAVIEEGRKAAEEKRVGDMIGLLTEDFVDGRGNGRHEVRRYLVYRFFREELVSVTLHRLQVEVEGEKARVSFYAVMSGRDEEGAADILPERMSVYVFDLDLAKIKRDWRVRRAEWEKIDPEEILRGTGEASRDPSAFPCRAFALCWPSSSATSACGAFCVFSCAC